MYLCIYKYFFQRNKCIALRSFKLYSPALSKKCFWLQSYRFSGENIYWRICMYFCFCKLCFDDKISFKLIRTFSVGFTSITSIICNYHHHCKRFKWLYQSSSRLCTVLVLNILNRFKFKVYVDIYVCTFFRWNYCWIF
jgi:hypothetical protein